MPGILYGGLEVAGLESVGNQDVVLPGGLHLDRTGPQSLVSRADGVEDLVLDLHEGGSGSGGVGIGCDNRGDRLAQVPNPALCERVPVDTPRSQPPPYPNLRESARVASATSAGRMTSTTPSTASASDPSTALIRA